MKGFFGPSPQNPTSSSFYSFSSSSSAAPSLIGATANASSSQLFGMDRTGASLSPSFQGPPLFGSSSTNASNLFGSAAAIGTTTAASPFSSKLFGYSSSSSSSSTSALTAPFPYLFGSSSPNSSTSFSSSSSHFAPAFSFPPSSTSISSSHLAPAFSFPPSSASISSSSPTFPAFGVSSSSSTTAPSSAAVSSSGQSQSTTSPPPPPPLVGAPFPTGEACSGCSKTVLKVGLCDGEEEVMDEDGQGRDGLAEQSIVSMAEHEAVVPGLRTNQDMSKKVVKMEVSSVQEGGVPRISATSFVAGEVATDPSVVSMSVNSVSKVTPAEFIVVTTDAPKAELHGAGSTRVTDPGKEVQLGQENVHVSVELKVYGISGVTSTVIAGDEESARVTGSQTFCVSAPFIDVNGYCISAQNGLFVKQIFDKYGDITKGSRIKSIAAKSGFLELVADAVCRLRKHTMMTLGLDELRLIEQHTADALAVGFHVNWLQQRVEKMITASDYYLHLKELDKLAKQIDDTKKSLMEMELRQMICTQEVAAIKDKMEENGFGESNLSEGLL